MDASFLDGVYERHRWLSLEQVLKFPVFVGLIADELVQHRGSGRQALERDTLPTSIEAAYSRLRRAPLSLSEEFQEDGAAVR